MPNREQYGVQVEYPTVTIASGQTESGAINLHGMSIVGVNMPAAFTGTSLTFKGSTDGTTYNDIFDSAGTQMSATVAASRFIPIAPNALCGVRFLKIVSGSSEGAERVVTLVLRRVA